MHRSLVIEKPSKLSYTNGCIVVEQDSGKASFPVPEIDALIVDNRQSVITTALISKLASVGVDTIICDKRHLPGARLGAIANNVNGFARVTEQLSWSSEVKNAAWRKIVTNKMNNQIALAGSLCRADLYVPRSQDLDNNEGILARMYFSRMFGRQFVRHADDDVNAMLNYGYSLLLSLFARIISSRGYLTQIGLHHRSKTNNNNFVCDVMEPFRVFVDEIVFRNKNERFDKEQKTALLEVYNRPVEVAGRTFSLSDAAEFCFDAICAFLNGKSDDIPEVKIT